MNPKLPDSDPPDPPALWALWGGGLVLMIMWSIGTPMWSRVAVTVCALFTAFRFMQRDFLTESHLRRTARRTGKGYCPNCHYELDIAESAIVTCPECGRTQSTDAIRSYWCGPSVLPPSKKPGS